MTGPTWVAVVPLGMGGAVVWSLIGWPVARRCLPSGVPAAAVGPLLGWCIQTGLAMTLLRFTGFGLGAVGGTLLLALAASWALHVWGPPPVSAPYPAWLALLCGMLACLPAAALLPTRVADGIRLASPMFDHSKIAMVDAMLRQGVPPTNPFYGGADAPAHLAYYWWWHASAAELARLAGATGWTGDAALTWFTAYATLMLMGGLGMALGGRPVALLSVALALPASIRPLTNRFAWLHSATGLGGWLNQVTWAPHHVIAAGAVVLSVLLLARLLQPAPRSPATTLVALACTVAAGFGSSAWVGGIVCAAALPAAAVVLVPRPWSAQRTAGLAWAAAAGLLGLALIAPLLHDQLAATRGPVLALSVYPSFTIPGPLRDLAGFPLTMLIEFPALVLLSGFGIRRVQPAWQTGLIAAAAAGLAVCLFLRSAIENNDLGWRAVIPALLVFAPLAAAGAWRLWQRGAVSAAAALAAAAVGLIGTWPLLRDDTVGRIAPDNGFVEDATAWQTVRRLTAITDRIASDPRASAAMTPWAANIGWALLADRSSCYSGWATARTFTPVPTMALYATDLQLRRIFDGTPAPGDLTDLATRLRCHAALLTKSSPAWTHDPFPPTWHLAAAGPSWRVYLAPPPD